MFALIVRTKSRAGPADGRACAPAARSEAQKPGPALIWQGTYDFANRGWPGLAYRTMHEQEQIANSVNSS